MNTRNAMIRLLPVLIFAAVAISTYHVAQEMYRYDELMAYVLGALLGLVNAVAAYFFLEETGFRRRLMAGTTVVMAVTASTWLQMRYYQNHGAGIDAYVLGTWAPIAELLLGALFAVLTADEERSPRTSNQTGALNAIGLALAERIRTSAPAQPNTPTEPNEPQATERRPQTEQEPDSKEAAMAALLAFYRQNPGASYSQAGEQIGRSKSTVSNYLDELERSGAVHRNGNGVEILNT